MEQYFFFHHFGAAETTAYKYRYLSYKHRHLLIFFIDQYTYKESIPNFASKWYYARYVKRYYDR